MWIESHSEILTHTKLAKLSALTGWNKYECIGRLHAFWWWVGTNSRSGDLSGFYLEEIGSSVGLDGEEAKKFFECMVKSGWIDKSDGVFRVHDWPTYSKRWLRETAMKNQPEAFQGIMDSYYGSVVSGPVKQVLDYLNSAAGRYFRPSETHVSLIKHRLQEVDGDVEGVCKMIDRQVALWRGDAIMEPYLRPTTLFNKTKFQQYYDDRNIPAPTRASKYSPMQLKEMQDNMREKMRGLQLDIQNIRNKISWGDSSEERANQLKAKIDEHNRIANELKLLQ